MAIYTHYLSCQQYSLGSSLVLSISLSLLTAIILVVTSVLISLSLVLEIFSIPPVPPVNHFVHMFQTVLIFAECREQVICM